MAIVLPEVKIASVGDEEALMEMCRRLHAENGLFSLHEEKLRPILRMCYARQRSDETPVIVGVIKNAAGQIEASTCMMVSDFYYTYDWHLAELWNYVEPEFRKSRNAEALIEFGKACSDKMQIPYFTGIITNKQMTGKVRLYRRLLGTPTGAFFVYNGKWKTEPMEDHKDLRRRLREVSFACNSDAWAKDGDGAFKLSATALRKRLVELSKLLSDAADAIENEDQVWGAVKPKGDAARND